MRQMPRLLGAALLCSYLCCSVNFLWAQTTQTLDEVTVTANKFPQKLSQTGKVITVLSDSVLQRYASQSVAQVLTRQAGLMIVGAQGPLGSNQEIYLRGASTGNTLILLDGIPVYDPSGTANTFDLNLLSVGDCERIEILKGAQSTAYGSDAVAGVISITTRKAGKKPLGGFVNAQYGTFNTFRGSLGISGATHKLSYGLQYTRISSTGFSAATDRNNVGTFDADGFTQNALLGHVAVSLRPTLTLKIQGTLTDYKTDLDAGAFSDARNYMVQNQFKFVATGLEWTHTQGKLIVNYSLSDTRRHYQQDSSLVQKELSTKYIDGKYGGLAHFAEVYHVMNISKAIVLLTGVDYRAANTDQAYFSVSNYGPYRSPSLGKDTAQTNQVSVYASTVLRPLSGLALEIGGRYNHHSIYGSVFTYSFNPSYLIHDQLKIFANLSSGFRAPVLYQLYSPYGNKELKPEKSQSAEVGVQVFTKSKSAWLRSLYFDRRINDVIYFQSLSKSPYGRYINFDKQHDQGWEFEGQAQVNKWSFTANLTLLDGQITTRVGSRDTTFNNLFRRPKTLLNMATGYQVTPNLFGRVATRSVSQRNDQYYNDQIFATQTVILSPYTTIDLFAEYRVGKTLRVQGDIQNLFNQSYSDAYGYSTRRRTATIGLLFTW